MGNIKIFGAAIGFCLSEAEMLDGTAMGIVPSDLAVSLERASELGRVCGPSVHKPADFISSPASHKGHP